MTVRYYDPSASGANNGTSWTDAYEEYFTALAACPGSDILFVKYGANEVDTTDRNWNTGLGSTTMDTPVLVYVAGNGDTSEPPTTFGGKSSAKYTNTLNISEVFNVDIISHGLDMQFGRGIDTENDKFHEWVDCVLTTNIGGSYEALRTQNDSCVNLINVDLASNASRATGVGVQSGNNAKLRWLGGSFGASYQPKYAIQPPVYESGDVVVMGIDMSGLNTSDHYLVKTSVATDELYYDLLIRNCLLGANVNVADSISRQGINISLDSCDVASGDTSRTEDHGYYGSKVLDTGIYRTGGADDGDPYSFAITTNSKCSVGKYWRISLGRVDADVSDSTLTVHFCRTSGKANLTDNEIWIEAIYPDDASPLGNYVSDRNSVPFVAGTAQATSTESWTGITTPVKQKSSVTIAAAAAQAGEVEVFLCIAYDGSGANDEVYVCPKVEVA